MELNVTSAKQILSNPPDALSDMLSNVPNGTKSALLNAGFNVNPSSNGQKNILDSPTLPIQVVNEEKEFTPQMSKFIADWGLSNAGFNYDVVAVFGSQSTGKSTLLNRLFGTTFQVMNESERRQTTKGIWACRGKGMSVMVMDVEGTDGRERGEDQDFERKSALFSLASSEVLIVNIWEHQVGLYQGANMGLLKTVFEVNLSLFGGKNTSSSTTQKTLLLFVIRDHVGSTPLSNLAQTLSADLNKIWDSLSKPQELASRRLTDYFDLSFTTLPHKILMPDKFESEVLQLRKRFTDKNRDDFVFKPAYHKRIPADGVAHYMEGIWEQVQSNKDLDLPTQQELLAQFRCDEIAAVALEQFTLQSKSARKPIESGKVQEDLGQSMRTWRDEALARFDRDASRYHAGVYKRKRGDLVAQIHANLSPLFFGQIKNLHKHAVVSFKKAVLDGLKGDSYDFAEVVKKARMTWEGVFVDGANEAMLSDTDWTFEEELNILREDITHIGNQCRADETKKMINQIERNMRNQISEPIELALNKPSPTMWDSVLKVFRDVLSKASDVYLKKAQSFNCTDEENTDSLNILQRRGWSALRSKVDEQTSDPNILSKLRSTFEERFRYDEQGVPRVWKPEDDIDAAFRKARDQTLELVPLYSRIQPQDSSLEFSLPSDIDEAALASTGEPTFDFPSTLVVFTESKQLDLVAKFRREADAYYVEAKRSIVSSVAQVPMWIYMLMVVLGWNEAMAVLFNPVYFTVLLLGLGSAWVIVKLSLVEPLLAVVTTVTGEIQRQATARLREYFSQPQLTPPVAAQNRTSSYSDKRSSLDEYEMNARPELSPM